VRACVRARVCVYIVLICKKKLQRKMKPFVFNALFSTSSIILLVSSKKFRKEKLNILYSTHYFPLHRSYFSSSVRVPAWITDFSLLQSIIPTLGPTKPTVQCVAWMLSLGREAEHSPPASAEVKNTWIS
jgi:hypothetical protein